MPGHSERKKVLRQLKHELVILAPYVAVVSIVRFQLTVLSAIYRDFSRNRYLKRYPDPDRPARRDFKAVIPKLLDARDVYHRQMFRVSRLEMRQLVRLFGGHPIFVSSGRKPQTPPQYQLALLLYRLAHSQDVRTISRAFGISDGTVVLWTDRALIAVVSQRNKYVYWPIEAQRELIKQTFLAHYGIPDCIGLISGYQVNLAVAPAQEVPGHFHSYKERYGYNVMVVVDDCKRFRYIHVGFSAVTNDQRIQRAMRPVTDPEGYFSAGEYLLADSGFTCGENFIPMFRKARGESQHSELKGWFNHKVAPARVMVEHSIGVMKGRWQALKNLRMAVHTKTDQSRTIMFIEAGVILHSIMVEAWRDYVDVPEVSMEEAVAIGEVQDEEGLIDMRDNYRRRERLIRQMRRLQDVVEHY